MGVLVVVAVAFSNVPQAVEVRANVALAEPGVFHVGEIVLTQPRSRRETARCQHRLGEAGAEQRHAVDERIAQAGNLAVLDLCCRGFRHGRRDTIGGTGLVVLAERRRWHDLATIALCKGARSHRDGGHEGYSRQG